ncbi:MAG: ABC transporter substrate-binding protein [Acidimicrobiia bacterium]|nr:MAG: ABC transporter substrate-binding protein [Acidimicrobiia bacterium]
MISGPLTRMGWVVGLALLVGACTGAEGIEPADSTTSRFPTTTVSETSTAPIRETSQLVAALDSEPRGFDPHLTTSEASLQVLENVYDTLVEPGADMTMQPALATEWEISQDGLAWTFSLREDVVFHNGRPLVADDVVYSFERLMDPDLGAANAFRFASIEEVTAIDDHTVQITLNRPTPNLLEIVGGFKGMAIVPREIVEADLIDTQPVGTGPFRFVSAVPGGEILLERNPDYWRSDQGLPHLNGIRFVTVSDPLEALTGLVNGELDWIDSVSPSEAARLQNDGSVVVQSIPSGDYHYLTLNQTRPPFGDVRVRRAIAMAIDREAVAEAARPGAATPNQTAIPPSSFWYHDYEPYRPADLESARALLEEAGVEGLTIELLVTSDFPETVVEAQVVTRQLQPLGIQVHIVDVDFATWLDRQADGEFDAFLSMWIGNLDPDDFYYGQHHCNGKFNFQGYCNAEVDALLDAGRLETDPRVRKALYDDAAELIVDEASYIYLYNPDVIQAWAAYVTGYQVGADGAARFVETRLDR